MKLRQTIVLLLSLTLLSSTAQAQNERRDALTIRLLQWAVGILNVGFWKIYVDHFSPQHIADIEQICGEEALGAAFDEGYIVETRPECIARLKARGWVVNTQRLPK